VDPVNQNLEGQQDATTQEGGEGTAISKFKSAEDRDKAYLELEQKHSQQAQELAEMKRRMDDFSQSQQLKDQQQDQRTFTDQYKSADELKKFWARFAENPQEILGAVEERAIQKAEQRIAIREAARDLIADFKAKNPDLAPYDEIVTVYVNQQPTNLTPRERLERAAPLARKMITQIAQKGGNANVTNTITSPDTFVESPSGNRQAAPAAPQKASEEDALTEYLREQSEMMAKKMVPPQKRAS